MDMGAYRAVVGDFYNDRGLSKKQAKKFIESEIADYHRENAEQYATELSSATWLNYQAAWFARGALGAAVVT